MLKNAKNVAQADFLVHRISTKNMQFKSLSVLHQYSVIHQVVGIIGTILQLWCETSPLLRFGPQK